MLYTIPNIEKQEYIKMKKQYILFALTFLLSACGGSGTSDSSSHNELLGQWASECQSTRDGSKIRIIKFTDENYKEFTQS